MKRNRVVAIGVAAVLGASALLGARSARSSNHSGGESSKQTGLLDAIIRNDAISVNLYLSETRSSFSKADGPNPIIVAAEFADSDILLLFIRRGVDVNTHGYALGNMQDLTTPLNRAIVGRRPDNVRMLLHAGADANQFANGLTPLMLAASRQFYSDVLIRLLIYNGANANLKDESGRLALHFALDIGSAPCERSIVALCRRTRNLDQKDVLGMSPLHWSAAIGYADGVAILLRQGVSINTQDERHRTPLMLAAGKLFSRATEFRGQDYAKVVRLLMKAKADVAVRDAEGKSAIDYARRSGREDTLRALLETF